MSEIKKTNDGKKGGLLKGKPHYDENGNSLGGIKAIVTDADRPVELEGGEVIINKHAAKKHWKELSKINQSAGGGVPISEPVFKKGGNLDSEDKKDIYQKWKSLVNMSFMELKHFYDSEEGKKAGLKAKDADKLGIDYGRESARWIMKMKKTPMNDWTPQMWKWANKQISFISRMSGAKGSLTDDKGNKTRKHLALLIWGHNPNKKQKFDKGGKVVTYKNKFNKKHGFDINESHSLSEIAKLSKLKLSALQDIYDKGIGAYKTNPQSVRPNVKSKEQWAMARVYSAIMGGKAAKVDRQELSEGKMGRGSTIKKKNKGGDCYQAAGDFIINNMNKKAIYLVHGQVTGQGDIEGIKYGHAWIEDEDGNVYDYSNGRNIVLPKQLYYIFGRIEEKKPYYYKYTIKEAREKMLKTGHYGPWDLKTETGL